MKLTHPHKPASENMRRPSWKDYQSQLNRGGKGRFDRRLFLRGAGCMALVLAALWTLIPGSKDTAPPAAPPGSVLAAVDRTLLENPARSLLSKVDVQDILAGRPAADLLEKRFHARWGDQNLTVDSSIDEALQGYLGNHLYERTSRYIAIVVMEAASGRILALVGFDNRDQAGNPCLSSQFPAASVFKIVTAGAAIEHCNLSSSSTLTYNGAKHTLYKTQLTEVENRYTHRTTLAASFADSVNPVFGKLGRHCLGQAAIAQYADAFGFNRAIPFELPLPVSLAVIGSDPYQWAEVASGFNRETLLSPLHGALIAAVPLNTGLLLEPSLVDRITDPQGRVLYRAGQNQESRAVTAQTAKEMAHLMRETVSRGTARKIFRSSAKDRILSQLDIGGKTGSIDNAEHDARYDWFVGFARHAKSREAISVAVVVAHEKYIGRRAGEYARMAMKEYFSPRLSAGSDPS